MKISRQKGTKDILPIEVIKAADVFGGGIILFNCLEEFKLLESVSVTGEEIKDRIEAKEFIEFFISLVTFSKNLSSNDLCRSYIKFFTITIFTNFNTRCYLSQIYT